ncbi:hypothetical protein ABPG75_001353 [Micractinium tetrahymenae]
MTQRALWALLLLGLLAAPSSEAGSPEKDREILVRFRDSIANWAQVKAGGNLEGWDDSLPAYLWTGVVLDFDLRVREIKLPCFDFMYCTPVEGPIFTEFAQLERLETLELSGNRFVGDLPDEWAAPGAFPSLQALSLSSARLNGSLPRSWGNPGSWPALKELTLNDNSLRGPLPPEWGNRGAFARLEKLGLEKNAFSGSLPASWGRARAFPALQTLVLADNGFRGQLPGSWGSGGGLRELVSLQLPRCGLSGALPEGWAAPDRFPKLATLELRQNNLSGTLPSAWGCAGCFPALQELFVLNNSLSGELPASWGALGTLRVLDASLNALQGTLPEAWAAPGALPQLVTLALAGNRLRGSLPGAWGRPEALPALSWLDVSFNNLTGSLPDAWGVPNSFIRLRLLDLRHNGLSGPLPGGAGWSLNATLQQLFTLSLAHNQLTGSLPDEWGTTDNSLAALYALDVSFNRLNGSLPASWGTRPSALSSLTSLAIAGNDFGGEVPRSWGLLPAMHYLVLAPGNNHVCRPLPYAGQFVTCLGEGTICKQPVQLRPNCSSSLPGWVPYPPDRGVRSLTGLQIGLIVSGVSLVAACSTLLVLRYREQRRWQALEGGDAELALREGQDPLADLIAATAARKRGAHNALADKLLKECRIDQSDIMFCRDKDGNLVQLGAGAYGQVYKAFLHGVHPVAVKVFQTQDDVPVADFWKEVSILRTCRHRNIVRFQGACVDGDTTMMVTELMDTDLYRALQSNRVSWYRHGHDIAIDVAQALHFLHSRSIIHFDCKSPNILLSATNQAKLADVGWAQILYHSYITGDGGTFNWAAPEQLIGLKCTAKADVYSFGLVLWELCTRELPVRGQIRDIRIPQEAPQVVADLIRQCLDVDPARRPDMEDIIHRLVAEKERLAAEASRGGSAGAGSSSGAAHSGRHRHGSSSSDASSLNPRALAGLPGRSLHGSSEQGSGIAGDASASGGAPSSGGRGGGSSTSGAAPVRGHTAAGSVDSSLWRTGSSPADGSQASGLNSILSFDGMPVGGSALAHSGRSGPAPDAGDRAARAGSSSNHPPSSFDGMSVAAGLEGGSHSSGWYGGSSSGGGGGSSGAGGGSSDAGGGSVFAGSAWAAGKPAAALTAGAAAFAGPSIFEGSAWAAGRPAAALGHGGGSGGASTDGSLAGDSSLGAASMAGAGGVFQQSPWWNSGAGTSQAGGASTAGGSLAGGSLPTGPSLGRSLESSPWWTSGTSTGSSQAGTAGAAGSNQAGGQAGSQAGAGQLPRTAPSQGPSTAAGSSGPGSELGSLPAGRLWLGAGSSNDCKDDGSG